LIAIIASTTISKSKEVLRGQMFNHPHEKHDWSQNANMQFVGKSQKAKTLEAKTSVIFFEPPLFD
jgi:hypothetical protein